MKIIRQIFFYVARIAYIYTIINQTNKMTNPLLAQFKPVKQSETIVISTKEEMIKVQKRAARPTYTNATITTTDDSVKVILEGYNDNFRDCICEISKDVWNSIDIRKFSNFLIEQISINQDKCFNNPNLK